MNAKELREKSLDDLNVSLLELCKERANNRIQRATGQINQTHIAKQIKNDIARVKTVIGEKLREN
ncbi:MAG: 50S ribosomal protein L29 [Methylococcales bacterium]|jgi:large subunit ribosomal protein L29|nr:50S ribosomal protein L29 [Methylococcales bacterium]MBT7445615.1 50S ribosomal protein L29 [Methylococcales bacterium]